MPEKMSGKRAKDSRENLRRKRRERTKENLEFYECIRDIVGHPAVLEMKKFYQHCDTDVYKRQVKDTGGTAVLRHLYSGDDLSLIHI